MSRRATRSVVLGMVLALPLAMSVANTATADVGSGSVLSYTHSTKMEGTDAGTLAQVNCPDSSALSGLTYLEDDTKGLNQAQFGAGLVVTCTSLDANLTANGTPTDIDTIVALSGKGRTSPHSDPTACVAGSVAVGDQGQAGTYLNQVGLRCRPLTGGVLGPEVSNSALAPPDATGGSQFGPDDCNDGEMVIGVDVRYSTDINGLALRCASFAGFGIANLEVTSAKATTAPGATDVDIHRIPSADLPVGAIDSIMSAPLRSVPLRSVSIADSPLRSVPLRSVPLRSVPLSSVPLRSVLLSQVPLTGITWATLLAGTPLQGVPLTNVTLDQALAVVPANSPTMDQVDLSQTPLRNISVTSVMLGSTGLGQLPIPSPSSTDNSLPTTTTDTYNNWCAWVANTGSSCTSLGLTASSPVLAADLEGVPLRSVPLRSVPLRSVPVAAPLRSVPLRSVDVVSSPLRSVPLRSVSLVDGSGNATVFGLIPLTALSGSSAIRSIVLDNSFPTGVVTCSIGSAGCVTLGDAISAGALTSPTPNLADIAPAIGNFTLADLAGAFGDITIGDLANLIDDSYPLSLGDIMLAMLPAEAVPWESLPFDGLDFGKYAQAPNKVTFTLSLDLTGGSDSAAGTVGVDLPAGFRYAGLQTALGSKESIAVDPSGEHLTLHLERAVPAAVSVSFDVVPGQNLGDDFVAAAHATFTSTSSGSASQDWSDGIVSVVDGTSTFDTAPTIQPQHLIFGYIGTPGEIDYYKFDAPQAGTHIHVLLSHLPTDDDLVVYSPQSGASPPNSAPLRSVPLRSVPLPDNGIDANTTSDAGTPQPLNDVPIRAGEPLAGESAHQGLDTEEVNTVSLSGDGSFTVQVTGYNGATSGTPYVLRVIEDTPVNVSCGPVVTGASSTIGAIPTVTSSTRSLFLINTQQMQNEYGDITSLMTSLNTFASRGDVAGAVVPVDADPTVSAAYASWNANPCSSARADAVVLAINAVVRSLEAQSGNKLTSVVLVGADSQLPMYRTPDLTLSANENGYAESDGLSSGFNPLSAAQTHGDMLTDDAYGSLQPVAWLDRRLYLPDLAVGRLVETPGEIQNQLDQFTTAGGALAKSSALTTGYDFLSDGATAVDAALGLDGISARQQLINATWTRADLNSALFPTGGAPSVDSINAHFDHNRALPSAGNTTNDESDLWTVADVDSNAGKIPGRLLFSMGCHAGLNVPDHYVTDPQEARDWAQTFAKDRAVWVANTGFGLGDTASVALSEELMRLFAQRLDGTMTAGQALQYAKQTYFGELGAYGVYDEKAMEEPVFYGLPMWRVGGPAWQPGSGNPPVPSGAAAPSDNPAAHASVTTGVSDPSGVTADNVSITPDFTSRTVSGRGTYWTVGGESQFIHYRPIQPRTSVGLLPPTGLQAHGSLITALTSSDYTNVNPVIARPTIDLSANEPEPVLTNVTFPTQFAGLTSFQTPGGTATRLVFLPGQFFSGPGASNGTQRIFTSMQAHVLYSSSSNFDPPLLTNATSTNNGDGTVTFGVDATTAHGTITRVFVLYHAAGLWKSVELSFVSGHHYSAVVTESARSIEWFAQAANSDGNTAATDDKGDFFGVQSTFAPSVTGTTGTNGWFTSQPIVDASGPASRYYVVVDGVSLGSVPQTIPDGTHFVEIDGTDGTTFRIGTVKVDTTPPTATMSPSSFALNGSGAYTISCSDGDAGSGVTDCPGGGTVNTTVPGAGSISFPLHDAAGNAAAITLTYVVGPTFVGYLQPVNDPAGTAMSVFKFGSTIPLKFQLKNAQGSLIADSLAQAISDSCGAKVSFAFKGTSTAPVSESTYSDSPASGGCFRYDSTAKQFIYNLGTKSLPSGAAGQLWSLRTVVTYNAGVIADHAVTVATK